MGIPLKFRLIEMALSKNKNTTLNPNPKEFILKLPSTARSHFFLEYPLEIVFCFLYMFIYPK